MTYNNATYKVVSIGKKAFYEYNFDKIIIPNSVTKIGEDAFFFCEHLTDIEIGKGGVKVLNIKHS